MPFPQDLPKKIRDILFGDPWGFVWPPRAQVPAAIQQVDGRTVALRVLKDYVSALVFFLPQGFDEAGAALPPEAFQIDPENFHVDTPPAEEGRKYPSCAVISSRAEYQAIGLGTTLQEETRDVYAPGTVVQWQSDYVETINLEVWASEEPALRSLLAGLETALTPTEQMYGIRFRMAEYFDQLVTFALGRRENYDSGDAARGRRHAQLEIEMNFNICALVDYSPLQPQTMVAVDYDPDTGLPFDLSTSTTIPLTDPRSNPPPPAGAEYVGYPDAADAPGRPRYP